VTTGQDSGQDSAQAAGGPGPRYSFPVEIEVVGELGEEHLRRLADHVFARLDTALRARH
jgi:hypothetical protein